MWLAEEFNVNCWDNPAQGKHERYERRRKGKDKGTAWEGKGAEAVFMVGKGMGEGGQEFKQQVQTTPT